nr:hypothetical protein Iba_chr06bCG13540 [Ipomoea batatas]
MYSWLNELKSKERNLHLIYLLTWADHMAAAAWRRRNHVAHRLLLRLGPCEQGAPKSSTHLSSPPLHQAGFLTDDFLAPRQVLVVVVSVRLCVSSLSYASLLSNHRCLHPIPIFITPYYRVAAHICRLVRMFLNLLRVPAAFPPPSASAHRTRAPANPSSWSQLQNYLRAQHPPSYVASASSLNAHSSYNRRIPRICFLSTSTTYPTNGRSEIDYAPPTSRRTAMPEARLRECNRSQLKRDSDALFGEAIKHPDVANDVSLRISRWCASGQGRRKRRALGAGTNRRLQSQFLSSIPSRGAGKRRTMLICLRCSIIDQPNTNAMITSATDSFHFTAMSSEDGDNTAHISVKVEIGTPLPPNGVRVPTTKEASHYDNIPITHACLTYAFCVAMVSMFPSTALFASNPLSTSLAKIRVAYYKAVVLEIMSSRSFLFRRQLDETGRVNPEQSVKCVTLILGY